MSRLLSTRWMGTPITAHAGLITFFGGGAGVEPDCGRSTPQTLIEPPSLGLHLPSFEEQNLDNSMNEILA